MGRKTDMEKVSPLLLSSLFDSLQFLICLCSTSALIISLSSVPYLSLLDPRAPHYCTLSSPVCLCLTPTLIISLSLVVSTRARKRPVQRREIDYLNNDSEAYTAVISTSLFPMCGIVSFDKLSWGSSCNISNMKHSVSSHIKHQEES